MGKRIFKSVVSWILALAMVVTLAPVSPEQVSAAAKVSLSNSKVTVTEGMAQTLKVKNLTKGAKVKWQSLNKKIAVVNSTGEVKGVKDGNTTIKCTVTKGRRKTVLKSSVTVKTPKFKQKSYQVVSGGKVSLALTNKYSGSKYQWSSSDKTVATVNAKGQVTGVSSGSAVIAVKVSIPKKGSRKAKNIKKKVTVSVTDEAEVTTQAELEAALKNQNIKNLILKTDSKEKYIIPEGNYQNVCLTVDAPNADVENHGNFQTITIKQIATDTWTEMAKNNVLILDAAAGHVVIPADAGIREICVVHASSNFKLEVQGDVEKISIDSEANVDINLTGKVQKVDVNSRATVSIQGTSADEVTVNVGEKANGTTFNSNVKASVTAAADTEINLSKGAEGSTVKTTTADKSVEVTNNTGDVVSVTNKDGKNQSVSSGKNATVNGNGEVTGTTTPDSGSGSNPGGSSSSSGGSTSGGGSSSSGGGSSSGGSGAGSSGNLTRVVTKFESVRLVEAGIYGTPLKSVEELTKSFPTTVTGLSSSGDVVFPVQSWENTDNYTAEASAGYYTFTAVLGEGNLPCTIQSGAKACVKVWVKPTNGGIIYTNEYNEDTNHFEVVEDKEMADMLVIKMRYTGEPYVVSMTRINYYNQSGDLIKSSNNRTEYFEKDDTASLVFDLPENASGEVVPYSAYTLSVWTCKEDEYQSVKNKLTIGNPSQIIESEEKGTYFELPIENRGTAEIQRGELVLYYWKGDRVIGIRMVDLSGVVGGETTNREIWVGRYMVDGEYVVPDGVTVDYNYANILADH